MRVAIEVDDAEMIAKFGPRFDRTAWVRSVQFHGKDMLGSGGLPDEFGLKGDGVLGYDAPMDGPGFIKIGVGRLKRVKDQPYFFSDRYPILKSYPVKIVSQSKNALAITQDGGDEVLPWSYRYKKTYLLKDTNTLIIRFELENCGAQPFSFNHYNHNWFNLDGDRVGPQHRLETGFVLVPPEKPSPYEFEPYALQPKTSIKGGRAYYYESELPGVTAEQNRMHLTAGTPYTVTITGDFPPARIAVYAQHRDFCPEVFFKAELQPGETAKWTRTYTFSVNAKPGE
ncbi:MAG: hypothetical protein H7Y06_04630 [Opitutaceae bacterium]|nr:hypothetical protein [Opitutaceae bacterium]